MLLFPNPDLRGPLGGPEPRYFGLKYLDIFEKKQENTKFQTKIAKPGAPWGPPKSHIWRKQHLSFRWKKNCPFIFFRSNFKWIDVLCFEKYGFRAISQILKSHYNDQILTWFSILTMFWSKKTKRTIFFPVKAEMLLFPNLKSRSRLGAPREALF